MKAGQGITYSARNDGVVRQTGQTFYGLQIGLALSNAIEGFPANFLLKPMALLPVVEGEGKTVQLIFVHAWGEAAPLTTPSEKFRADASLAPSSAIPLPDGQEDLWSIYRPKLRFQARPFRPGRCWRSVPETGSACAL